MVSCAAAGSEYAERSGTSSEENDWRDFMVILRFGIKKSVRLEKKFEARKEGMTGETCWLNIVSNEGLVLFRSLTSRWVFSSPHLRNR